MLKGLFGLILIGESGHIVVQHHIGLVGEGGNGRKVKGRLIFPHFLGDFGAVFGNPLIGRRFGSSAGRKEEGQGNQESGEKRSEFFHLMYTSSVILSWEDPAKSAAETFCHP